MSEDYFDKTEPPTQSRLDEARSKGIVARSQDFAVSVVLCLSLLIFFFLADYAYESIFDLTKNIFNNLNMPIDQVEIVGNYAVAGSYRLFWMMFPFYAGVIISVFLAQVGQIGFLFSSFPIIPKWERLNPFNPVNFQQRLGRIALVKLGFGLIRLNVVVVVSWVMVGSKMFHVYNLTKGSIHDMTRFMYQEIMMVSGGIAICYLAVGAMDYFFQKKEFERHMKMSKREIKEEMQRLEGDETIKQRMRDLMISFSKQNISRLVPHANLIICGGSNCAIVLRYDPKLMLAPHCLFKGTGKRAGWVRYLAQEYHVPMVDNSELAQKLFCNVQPHQEVPQNLYHDIAVEMSRAKTRETMHITEAE